MSRGVKNSVRALAGALGIIAAVVPGLSRAEFIVLKSNYAGAQPGDKFPSEASIDLQKGQWLRVIDSAQGTTSMLSGPYQGRIQAYRVQCSAVGRLMDECTSSPEPRLPIGGTRKAN